MPNRKNVSRDDLVVPLDKLVSFNGNVYEMTNAAISRARQIAVTGDPLVEENGGKIVSTAIKQVVSGEVQYRFDE